MTAVNDLETFLAMGGYAAYVWPSFGFALVVLAGVWLQARVALRRAEARLARLEALGLDRRARRRRPAPSAPGTAARTDGAADDAARA